MTSVNGQQPLQEPTPAADREPIVADAAALLREIRDLLAAQQTELLDAEGAAALCGISRATWDRLCAAGKTPPARRLLGCVRWSRAEILEWIRQGCLPSS